MTRRVFLLFSVFVLLAVSFVPASAQTYYFRIEKSDINLFINPDGTASVEYTLVFYNEPSADPIDYVDIGMPNTNYNLGSITAEVDGKTITDITSSPYVRNGIAFGLGSNAIQPGQRGTFHFFLPEINGVIFNASQEEAEPYASVEFAPHYYDRDTVTGTTDLAFTIILPPGLTTEEPRYITPRNWPGDEAPASGIDSNGRVFYHWQTASANSYTQYIFGAAFPARLVATGTVQQPPSEISRAVGSTFDPEGLICCGFFGVFAAIFGLGIYQSIWGARKRKLKYLPPKISIEGHGVKRGLTPVEAAVLMEQPIDKVLTLILFAVVRKNAATVTSKEPLEISVEETLPADLRAYETDFLEAFKLKKAERRTALQKMMVALVKEVTTKMKGFSRKETVEYYEKIMEQAWQQVEQADTPDVQMEQYEKYMDWTMLDRQYDERARRTFTQPVYVPMWWGRLDPAIGRSIASSGGGVTGGLSRASTGGMPSSGGKSVSLPHLPGSDFAASIASSVSAFSAGVIGDVTSFTSGVTNVTNPVPKAPAGSSYRGGGGGGGGGCACACACAGCACACAGGGR